MAAKKQMNVTKEKNQQQRKKLFMEKKKRIIDAVLIFVQDVGNVPW